MWWLVNVIDPGKQHGFLDFFDVFWTCSHCLEPYQRCNKEVLVGKQVVFTSNPEIIMHHDALGLGMILDDDRVTTA